MDVKYEPMHKPKSSTLDTLAGVIFRNPSIYFFLLFSVAFFILIFCPHTIVFKIDYLDVPDDFELSPRKSGWRVDENLPLHKYSTFPVLDSDQTVHHKLTINKGFGEVIVNKPSPTIDSVGSHSKLLASGNKPEPSQCKGFQDNERFDCFPQGDVSEDDCNNRGCCWAPVNSTKGQLGVPFCYYPSDFKTYSYSNISITDFGVTALLENKLNSSYPDNIKLLRVNINFLTGNTLQIKVSTLVFYLL